VQPAVGPGLPVPPHHRRHAVRAQRDGATGLLSATRAAADGRIRSTRCPSASDLA
jgi:hypothetical protein